MMRLREQKSTKKEEKNKNCKEHYINFIDFIL
jgi:hypothetical protein